MLKRKKKEAGSTVRPRAFSFKCPIYPNYNKVITVTLRTLRAPESLGPWDSCSLRPCWWAILAHYNTRKHRRRKKAINPDTHDLSWLSASENMSTQISFCCSMNKLQLNLMGTRRETTTHSEALSTKRNITITSSVKSPGSFAEHPPHSIYCTRRLRDKCVDRSRFLSGCLLENLFALPRQGEGASPPFWLLFSAPALSQHSVSSSQSPCQQDFTQWAGGDCRA